MYFYIIWYIVMYDFIKFCGKSEKSVWFLKEMKEF